MMWMLDQIDAVLMAPFRWPSDPMVGFWLGTLAVVGLAVTLGEAGLRLASRLNGSAETTSRGELLAKHELTMRALRAGNGEAYRGANRLATGAFDRFMGLGMARAVAVLWPPCVAAGWLQLRFEGVTVAEVSALGLEVSALAAFGALFVLARVALWRVRSLVRASSTMNA
jgi:hypothetical protein